MFGLLTSDICGRRHSFFVVVVVVVVVVDLCLFLKIELLIQVLLI